MRSVPGEAAGEAGHKFMRAWRNGRRAGLRNQFFGVWVQIPALAPSLRVTNWLVSGFKDRTVSVQIGTRTVTLPSPSGPRHHAYIVTFGGSNPSGSTSSRFVDQQAIHVFVVSRHERRSDAAEPLVRVPAERHRQCACSSTAEQSADNRSMQVQFLTGAPRFACGYAWHSHAWLKAKRARRSCKRSGAACTTDSESSTRMERERIFNPCSSGS